MGVRTQPSRYVTCLGEHGLGVLERGMHGVGLTETYVCHLVVAELLHQLCRLSQREALGFRFVCLSVCTYVRMYVRMFVCMYIRMFVCTRMYVCSMYVCMYVCIYVCMHVCMYVYVCTWNVYVLMYVCMFVRMHNANLCVFST